MGKKGRGGGEPRGGSDAEEAGRIVVGDLQGEAATGANHLAKRARRHKGLTIDFDTQKLFEFVGGFRKRRQQRQARPAATRSARPAARAYRHTQVAAARQADHKSRQARLKVRKERRDQLRTAAAAAAPPPAGETPAADGPESQFDAFGVSAACALRGAPVGRPAPPSLLAPAVVRYTDGTCVVVEPIGGGESGESDDDDDEGGGRPGGWPAAPATSRPSFGKKEYKKAEDKKRRHMAANKKKKEKPRAKIARKRPARG